jgi:phage-related protein
MRYTAPQKIQESASAGGAASEAASGLWEVRSALTGGKIARVLFCFHEEHLYALHGFIKKSRKTPPSDLFSGAQAKMEDRK